MYPGLYQALCGDPGNEISAALSTVVGHLKPLPKKHIYFPANEMSMQCTVYRYDCTV